MFRLALIASLLVAALTPAIAQATYPGRNGHIVFRSAADKGPDGRRCYISCLYSVRPDGKGLKRIASGANAPTFSPAGKLAYTTDHGVVTARADGRGRHLLRLDWVYGYGAPAFSPDGRRIALWDGSYLMRIIDARIGATSKRIALRWDSYRMASWGANNKLAIVRDIQDEDFCDGTVDLSDIYAMTPGGTPLRITTTYGASDPDWSPNGRQIVYTRNTAVGRGDLLRRPQVTGADCKISAARASTPKGNSLWIAAANGSAAHQITRGPGDFAPMFSPDGRRIAYMRVAHNYQRWIYVANADGSHKHRLYRGDSPAWQPIPR